MSRIRGRAFISHADTHSIRFHFCFVIFVRNDKNEMDVQVRNAHKIYAISAGPNIPEWDSMGEKSRRNLAKKDAAIRRRVELLQDFSMPAASSKLMMSKDANYIMAAGTYAPRIRCFELSELSMKFERYLDGEVVDMTFLGDDYGKLAILLNDRSVAFHAPYGHHTLLRLPTFGRSMAYEPTTCELLICCSGKAGRNSISRVKGGGEVYRINLDEGRFSEPLAYSPSSRSSESATVVGGNCITVSPSHTLTALGGDDGIVRFWDNRISPATHDMSLNPLCLLDITSSTSGYGFFDENNLSYINPHEVTAISFDESGLYFAAGTRGGIVALYDVRSSKPLHVKEHQYGLPIHTIRFHTKSSTILSGDSKLIKIWRSKPSAMMNMDKSDFDMDTTIDIGSSIGSVVANIEGKADFNHFIVAGDEKDPTGNSNGLVLCAGETPKIQSFYCPVLGVAPRWCSFLDNITEELEEKDLTSSDPNSGAATDITGQGGNTVYEDYKFLTNADIEKLGIQNLVGTPLLRGYMHGFFIDIGLYNRIRAVANPFEYEEYRKKKIREKMEEKRASRIAPKQSNREHKVNADLAERLERKADDKSKDAKVAKSLLSDDRFGSLFHNPDFEIDEDDINFKLRNPSGVRTANRDSDMDSDQDDESNLEELPGYGVFKPVDGGVENDDDDEEERDEWQQDDEITNEDAADDSSSQYSDSDNEGFHGIKVRGENYKEVKKLEKSQNLIKKISKEPSKKKKTKPVLYEEDDNLVNDKGKSIGLLVGLGHESIKDKKIKHQLEEQGLSLEERIKRKKMSDSNAVDTVRRLDTKDGISKAISYIPKDTRRWKQENKEDKNDGVTRNNHHRSRRGVQDIGIKPIRRT